VTILKDACELQQQKIIVEAFVYLICAVLKIHTKILLKKNLVKKMRGDILAFSECVIMSLNPAWFTLLQRPIPPFIIFVFYPIHTISR